MKKLLFLSQYISKTRTVGAVAPSSKRLAKKMVEHIDFNKARYIVEYGAGTGVFTDLIMQNMNKNTKAFIIELNEEFYSILKNKYGHIENVYIINGSAENIDKYMDEYNIPYIDYVLSGLPFASLPKNISDTILEKTSKILDKDNMFITFQYTLLKKQYIEQYFKDINITREFINLPPAYILGCKNI